MIIFYFLMFSGLILGVAHGIYIHKFGNYLKAKHPSKWNEIVPEKFLGVSKNNLESRNYFKEMGFVFSSDNLNDENIPLMKKRIKILLFATSVAWASIFVSLFFM